MSLEAAILGMTAELKRLNDFLASGTAPVIAGAGAEPQVAAQVDRAIETAEAEATEPKKPAKPAAAKPAAPKAEPKADAKPADPKPAQKEATMAEAQQAVVKLVTKICRDPTIKFMKDTFGSPNVSGLDLRKHSYAGVIKTIGAHIASLAEAKDKEQTPA